MKSRQTIVQGRSTGAALQHIFAFLPPMSRSGLFVAEGEGETVTFGIVERNIVFADTTAGRASERIGAILVKENCVDRRIVRGLLNRQRNERRKLGALLVESGKVDEQDLRAALCEQIHRRMQRVRSWPSFGYRFCAVRLTGDTGVRVAIEDLFGSATTPQGTAADDSDVPFGNEPSPKPVDAWRFGD